VLCELESGAARASDPVAERELLAELLTDVEIATPAPDALARTNGELLADLDRRGSQIATMDLLIASTAIVASARLVSANRRHFERVPGLALLTY
jgi:predicted nucleic acid-binding protein